MTKKERTALERINKALEDVFYDDLYGDGELTDVQHVALSLSNSIDNVLTNQTKWVNDSCAYCLTSSFEELDESTS